MDAPSANTQSEPQPIYLGESCICWTLGDNISRELSERIIALTNQVRDAVLPGVRDIVPAYTSLAVHFDPLCTDVDALIETMNELLTVAQQTHERREVQPTRHVLLVRYDGPDLDRVSKCTGLSHEQVIACHTRSEYYVAMIGFRPHFPYLIGLDPSLEVPRLETPRTKVAAGSVAIAGQQAAVYPDESPGGWNLIGWTEPSRLRAIQPGDLIQFQQEIS